MRQSMDWRKPNGSGGLRSPTKRPRTGVFKPKGTLFESPNLDSEEGYEDFEEDESEPSSVDEIPVSSGICRVLPAIRPSYFPFVPPYINFCLHDERTETLPSDIKKHLKWRLSPITPNVVKKTLTNSGFRILRKTVDWGGQWGKHMKAVLFKTNLKDFQKLNHLPGTFQLGRKDRLWRNLHRYMMKFGKEEFGFIPRSYCLPQDLKQLKSAWEASEQKKQLWIVKPPAGARGTGIRVVNKWNQIPKKKPVIVQSYISNPYLINDRKFDLRLYVLVTSFHPLKVYVYNDGLVRFAPVKYSDDAKRAGDRFMHLTNYSINKNCELYTHNEDAESCEGHKWTVKTLWKYLGEQGINTNALWDKIEEIVIKTFISAEEPITNSAHCLPNRYNGYELFGFDIILDSELKPWLLEVNISPSLHSSSPLDLAVKGPMIKEVFNIVGYQIPPKLSPAAKTMFMNSLDVRFELETPVFDRRIFTSGLSAEELLKHRAFKSKYDKRPEYLQPVLEYLTPDDVRHLIVSEDELSQCVGFCRIFPSPTSHSYFPYFETPKYYNILLDAWEGRYHKDRSDGVKLLINLCHQKIHLQVPITSNVIYENPESKTSEEDTGTSSTSVETPMDYYINEAKTLADNINEAKPTGGMDAEVENKLNGNGLSSISPSPVTAVLDNITNNNMRSLGTSNNGAINNCHDEDRLANEKTATPIANKVGDYVVKGMCF